MGSAEHRRWIRRTRRKLGAFLLPRFAPAILRVLSRSWKVTVLGQEHWDHAYAQPGMLIALWHGRMIVPLTAHEGRKVCVLVSPSADGQLVPPILKKFGFEWVWGSSNKNPARAVREMLGRLQAGGRIVITPDGPRGPHHRVNPGPAWMARETGFPLIALGCAVDRAWHLSSWDHFTIPKWGARVVVNYAEPLYVSGEGGDETIERATAELGARLLAAEEAGFRHLGIARDW
jgi:lysophospholipid acyltransferase (LPLAT)-like uncharacterized protein